MMPEHMREALWEKVQLNFGTKDGGVKRVALKLQDDGYGDQEIMQIVRYVWRAAYEDGYNEGRG